MTKTFDIMKGIGYGIVIIGLITVIQAIIKENSNNKELATIDTKINGLSIKQSGIYGVTLMVLGLILVSVNRA